jgi:hypothetical protein
MEHMENMEALVLFAAKKFRHPCIPWHRLEETRVGEHHVQVLRGRLRRNNVESPTTPALHVILNF